MLPNKQKPFRLLFTFSNHEDIQAKSTTRLQTWLDFPPAAQHLIQVEERLRFIGTQVGKLSRAVVHVSCKELGIANEAVNQSRLMDGESILISPNTTLLAFKNLGITRSNARLVEIIAPFLPGKLELPRHLSIRKGNNRKERHTLKNNLHPLYPDWFKVGELPLYYESLNIIREQVLVLLNSEPIEEGIKSQWQFIGFHPYWHQSEIAERIKKERSRLAELNQAPQKLQETQIEHRKGHRPGAIPGIFKGVQFRSQLEIRLATELETRGIRWIYEAERLGEGNYLVDFYLPDLKVWIEAKGKFEARDYYLLKDVAKVLAERGERLYVFTSGKPQRVSSEDFIAMKREDFWNELPKNPL